MTPRQYASLLSCLAFFVMATACSSSSNTASPANGDGVNDVVKACQIRAPWKSTSTTACNNCIGYSTTPRCPCADVDYAGKCSAQATTKNNEPTCAGVDACIAKCDRADCTCINACYAGKPACYTAASAEDGCVAEVCVSYCQ